MGWMWTKEHRARQLAFERGRRYPTDLTDAESEAVQPFLPKPLPRGRPWEVDLREILNAIRYLARTGCGWRMLPVHFGPWETVYWWFRRLIRRLLFQTVHDPTLMVDRSARDASLGRVPPCWTARRSRFRTHPAAVAATRASRPRAASPQFWQGRSR